MNRGFLQFLALLALPAALLAATTGSLKGTVSNADSGAPLAGANVVFQGTTLGAATDIDGEFFISNIPAGVYTLSVSTVGYSTAEITDLRIHADFETRQNVGLKESAIEGAVITIVAERPLVQLDKTASVQIMDAAQLADVPVRGYNDIIAVQSGVQTYDYNTSNSGRYYNENSNGPQLSVRGSRPDEVMFNVDGVSLNDPYSGLVTFRVPNLAWDEFTFHKGNFSAEYGRYMSGVVNWTTRSGQSDYKVTAEMETELGDAEHNYGDMVVGLGLSGPLMPGNDRHRFMVAVESFATDDLSPSYVDNGPKTNAGTEYISAAAKLTSNFSESMRLDVGFLLSDESWNEYRHSYYFNSEHMPYYEDNNMAAYGRFNYAYSKDINGTFTLGYTDVERFRGDNTFRDNLDAYGTESLATYPTAALFWDPERTFRNYMKRRTESLSWRLDLQMLFEPSLAALLTSDADDLAELESRHDLRFGLDGQLYTVRYYEHFFPNRVLADSTGAYPDGAFDDVDRFGYTLLGEEMDDDDDSVGPRKPTVFGMYLQDKISLSYGIRLDLGLRLDVLSPNTRKIKNMAAPFGADGIFDLDADTEETESFQVWSPRLGVSFPASENTTFHFNYGKYAQFPSFYSYYVGYEYYAHYINNRPYHTVLANPNLEPVKLTSFEFGIDHALGNYASVAFSAYYKDIKDYVNSQNLTAVPGSYSSYLNMDRAVTKGFEFEYRLQPYKRFSGAVNYTISWANGTGSGNDGNDRISHTAGEVPKYTNPLIFDRRHNLAGLVSYAFTKGDGPRVADYPVLENTVFGIQVNANSGRPYTKRLVYNEISLGAGFPENERSINTTYMDWNYQLDLQLTRKFAFGRVGLELSARVENLLDAENQVSVWETSGDAGTTYWLGTNEGLAWQQSNAAPIPEYDGMTGPEAYRFREDDPSNWAAPRRVFFGVTVNY